MARKRNTTTSSGTRPRGLFITFEGIEGSGKSTQCRRLAASLTTSGYIVSETREPGGTPIAERIRELLLANPSAHDGESMTPQCETALVMAARAQHLASLVRPALRKGHIVLCDRFGDSTVAYQGFGRRLDVEQILAFHDVVSQGLEPDLTILCDLPVTRGLARRRRATNQNRLDRESLAFHRRVRNGFLTLAAQHSDRFLVVNASHTAYAIATYIEHRVRTLAATRRLARLPGHRVTQTARR